MDYKELIDRLEDEVDFQREIEENMILASEIQSAIDAIKILLEELDAAKKKKCRDC